MYRSQRCTRNQYMVQSRQEYIWLSVYPVDKYSRGQWRENTHVRVMCNIRLTFFVASAATASSAPTAPRPLSFDPFPPDAGTETTLPDDSRETPRRPHPPRSRACLFPDGPCARSGSMPRPRRTCSSSLSLSPSSSEKAGCPRAAAPRRFFAAGCMGRNLDTGTIGRIGWRRGLVGGLNSSRGLSDSYDKISTPKCCIFRNLGCD